MLQRKPLLLFGYNAFFEDDIGIQGRFAGGDDCVGLFGPLIEGEALDKFGFYIFFDVS